MDLQFTLKNQVINRIDRNTVVSGSRNYLYAKFTFLSEDWHAPVTVIFGKYSMVLDGENKCLVPWEVLENPGSFDVSAFCGDLQTANTVRVFVAKSGYIQGETPSEPTPDVYTQLAGMVQDAIERAEEATETATGAATSAGEFADNAEKSAQAAAQSELSAAEAATAAGNMAADAAASAQAAQSQAAQATSSATSAAQSAAQAASSASGIDAKVQAAEAAKTAAEAAAETAQSAVDTASAAAETATSASTSASGSAETAQQAATNAAASEAAAAQSAVDAAERAEEAAAIFPNPSPQDAGKSIVVSKDGKYELKMVTGGGDGESYQIGSGLKVVDGTLMVDTVNQVEEDNTLPITSAAVYTTVGNIDALLQTI